MMTLILVCSLCTVMIELTFYLVVYRWFLIPAANRPVKAQPYRDYPAGMRHRFVMDVFERICRIAPADQTEAQALRTFLLSLFYERQANLSPPASAPSAQVRPENTIDHSQSSSSSPPCSPAKENRWTIEELGRTDMEHLLAWAAFGKHLPDLSKDELVDLERIFTGILNRFGLFFLPGSTQKYFAKQMGLENVNVTHRPLLVYVLVDCLRLFTAIWLLLLGFCRFQSQSGLTGWFRPATCSNNELPLAFFHGLAPAGLTFYLGFALRGLAADGRAVFLFENPAISMSLFAGFRPLSHSETVRGVQEIVERFLGSEAGIAVVGHSFGTVPVTWLMYDEIMRRRIRQTVLLDPITVLLVTCELMNTFLYEPDGIAARLMSPEIHIQNYLRRHFPFYNSDLDLKSVDKECSVLVCLSEHDEIVPISTVRCEVEHHLTARPNDKLIVWERSQHGECVVQRRKWKDITTWMRQNESGSCGRIVSTLGSSQVHGNESDLFSRYLPVIPNFSFWVILVACGVSFVAMR